MDVKIVSETIVKYLGGSDNIVNVANCMTRVRTTVSEASKVNVAELKKLSDVMGVIAEDTYIQIVVGPGKCKALADFINNTYTFNGKAGLSSPKKGGLVQKLLKRIANIFVPLIPVIIGAGLCNGIVGVITNIYAANNLGDLPLAVTFLSMIGNGLFAFLAIYVGMNAADEFGATRGLGGVLGALTLAPQIDIISQALGMFNYDDRLASILIAGKGGILGVIAGVALLAYIEKHIRKIVPYVLDVIITPFLSLIITATITVFAFMPVAGLLSDVIVKFLQFFIMSDGIMAIVGGFILASLFLPLLMVGLHHGLIPFYLLQLEHFGVITLFPILCMAGAGQIGAAIALYFKAKGRNEKLRDIIRGALPVGFLGIGEPLLYGVTLPMGLPFITASIAGGFAGAFAAATHVAAIAYGPAGLAALTIIQPNKMIFYFLSLCIAYVLGFVFTYLAPTPKAMDTY
ncbi:MAG: PTS transporter subunit EIIC [Alphaproteobacteria bacterium]|jgi:PTS system sucrose-specific IIC component|nr:PTS transporter subunit EIIC [Alphaproteobacteria bacterium]